jgi:hypothetical protein
MIRVQPVYKCLYCNLIIEGAVMELSDRPKENLIEDVMDFAPAQFEPHHCEFGFKGEHGVIQYVGFNHIGQD